jgi:hypothetical protein
MKKRFGVEFLMGNELRMKEKFEVGFLVIVVGVSLRQWKEVSL